MNYAQAIAELKRSDRILFTTHVKPDGDGLGSIAALSRWLVGLGKTVDLVLPAPPPARYQFLLPEGPVKVVGKNIAVEKIQIPGLLCIVDTGTWQQLAGLEKLVEACRGRVMVIDHHLTQDPLSDFSLVDAKAAAAVVIVKRLLSEAGFPLGAETASFLLSGLATDTDWFRLPNADAEVFRHAADLVAAGAVPWEVHERLFLGDDLSKVHLVGLALAGLKSALGGRAMVMSLTREIFRKVGTDPVDTENLINESMKVRGTQVAVMMVETDSDDVRVSLRSRPGINVGRVAEKFGGGGHVRASGMRMRGSLADVEKRILAALDEAMGEAAKPKEKA
jgi:phosphoesterase RecJ-like protein